MLLHYKPVDAYECVSKNYAIAEYNVNKYFELFGKCSFFASRTLIHWCKKNYLRAPTYLNLFQLFL